MTYMQLAGAVTGGSGRLGVEPTIWSPLLLLAAVVVFSVALVLLNRQPDEDLSEEPAE